MLGEAGPSDCLWNKIDATYSLVWIWLFDGYCIDLYINISPNYISASVEIRKEVKVYRIYHVWNQVPRTMTQALFYKPLISVYFLSLYFILKQKNDVAADDTFFTTTPQIPRIWGVMWLFVDALISFEWSKLHVIVNSWQYLGAYENSQKNILSRKTPT